MSDLASLVSLAASAVCIAMFVSPAQAALMLKKVGSVGALRINFYTMQLVNCCVWASYGLLLSNAAIIFSNVSGLAVAVFCMAIYLQVARSEEATGKQLVGGATVSDSLRLVAMAMFVTGTILAGATVANLSGYATGARTFMGCAGSAASCVMLAAPLQQAQLIVQLRNADVLNPLTVVLSVVNCFLWTTYGLLVANPFIFVPNGIGQLITLGQLLLLLRFGSPAQLPARVRCLHYMQGVTSKGSSDDVPSEDHSRHNSAHDLTIMVETDAARPVGAISPPAGAAAMAMVATPKLASGNGSFSAAPKMMVTPKLAPSATLQSSPKLSTSVDGGSFSSRPTATPKLPPVLGASFAASPASGPQPPANMSFVQIGKSGAEDSLES
jgi:solute carrier family 50 protein (sugar transporter)